MPGSSSCMSYAPQGVKGFDDDDDDDVVVLVEAWCYKLEGHGLEA